MPLSLVQPRLLPLPPQGLKVLLVSTDDAIHNCIKNQLLHLHYQIDTYPTRISAFLELLNNDKIDLVLSDFSLKDMDGCEFIAQVQDLRKNIPHVVIFEAEKLGQDEITKAFKLGACYILWKPVSEPSDEIKNLWQHVFRRRAQFERLKGSSSLVSSQQESLKRGNELNHGKEPSLKKRPRFVWTDERHARFVEAVKQLGKDAVPHKILRAMNGPGLTREIVGSHLQKHRENEKKKGGELRERIMNNANGRNRLGINNHILAPPMVSSSSYQRQLQHEQYLACQPMHLNNFGGMESNMLQQPHIALNPTSGMQDQNPCSSNMEQQSITHLISGMQQLYQNPGTQQLNPSSDFEIINQNPALSTSLERNNMEQQPDQTSCTLYAPIRSGRDGMMTLEATHVDELHEFGVGVFNQQFEFGLDVQSSDVLDIFPNWEDFLDDYLGADVYQEINAPLQEMNETQPSQLPDK